MASTASTKLKLELMTDGEKSNQWGQITNNNVAMLEGAVAGYVLLTLSGTSGSLSVTDYTLGDFHNATFKLGGTASGPYTLTVPTLEKVYIFENACSQTVTVQQAAGTGVTIANGKKAMVYSDGTNIVEFINAAVTETSTSTLTNKTLTSPVMTTPTLGVATATSINKITLTQPATNATLTLVQGSTLATAGAFSTTLTATGTTNVTLPTTGTLATLAGSEALTNKTVNGLTVTTTTGTLTLVNGSSLITAGGAFATTLTTSGATNVTLPTTGTLATVAGSETLTNKTLTTPIITVNDTQFTLQDAADTTKKINFDLANITTATTRTIQFPNTSGVLALEGAGGSSSTTVVGVLTAGTWNADIITGQYGGTGVNNSGKTITLGGSLTTSGAFATTLTVSGITNVTLPTSGTLISSTVTTLSSLVSIGTITTGTWNASVIAGLYGGTGVANSGKTITIGGNLAFSGAFATTFTVGATTTLTLPATGTLATLAGVETFTNKTFTTPTITFNDTGFTLQDQTDNSKKVVFELSNITTATTRTLTFPNASVTLASLTGTETLTNKTITSPIISVISNTGNITLPTTTDTLVGRATTDTLTNKTLTAPVISTISNTGTLTLPTSTDTLVGRATTDTLTNKTLTAPAINGSVTGTYTLNSPTIQTPSISSPTVTGTATMATVTASGTITGANVTATSTLTGAAATISSTAPTITLNDTDWGNRFIHSNGGTCGFLTSASGWALQVDDAGNTTATGNVAAYSDARLKTNVHTISCAMELVERMRGVRYQRIETGEHRVGVIAQEMQYVLPEVVLESQDGTLAVSYGDIVGVLIEAVKELSQRVRELEAR